jgi:dGTPase
MNKETWKDETKKLWTERQFSIETDETENRDDYSRDRARIIHSASFRRLQGKTQVLGLGESDFYRTRLTHSIEVSQIASGIAEFLKNKYKNGPHEKFIKFIPSQNLIEAISLAHDIGHPPFGHGGEVALNYLMQDYGGFEGNAQTIRICTQLGEFSENNGLNLSRRTLLGLVKYPTIHSKVVNQDSYKSLKIHQFKPPKFNFYDCDKDYFHWIIKPFTSDDRKLFKKIYETDTHRKTQYKSFDATIMELADDIAYGVHDLEDAIALKLVTRDDWSSEVESKIVRLSKAYKSDTIGGSMTTDLFSERNRTRKKVISYLVSALIKNIHIEKRMVFEHPLLDLKAVFPDDIANELQILKDFVVVNVIKMPEVKTLEYRGQEMIRRLFEAIVNNPIMLEKKHHQKYKKQHDEEGRRRVICDYIAGDTDEYATRLYHKIFTPSTGSIFDRL